jgi:endonuclease/exonuclease/phosphatase family metal-dependent hydrolase
VVARGGGVNDFHSTSHGKQAVSRLVKRFFLFAVACFFALNATAAPLRIVTWNTRWLPGGHPDASPEEKSAQMAKAQAIVKALNPDILLMQEVADWKAAQEVCSVVPGLIVRTTSAFITRPQQVVVASKLPVDSAWYSNWKPALGEDNPPRGYAFAAIKLPGNEFLLTWSVHFKSNRGELPANIAAREESAKQLLVHIAAMKALYGERGKTAILVGGDFNTSFDDPLFKAEKTLRTIKGSGLAWVFNSVSFSKRVTIPSEGQFPDNTFDHFFFSGIKLVSVKVEDGTASSDHNPVLAIMQP